MLFSAVALTACGEGNEEPGAKEIELLLWAASGDQVFMRKHADIWAAKYNKENGTNIKVVVGIMGEGDAGTTVITAPADAADVFMFADDQLQRLVNAGAIASLGQGPAAEAVKEANTAASVNAASIDGQLYAYPATSDNGYVLYYNKTLVTADDVKNWDTLMTAAQDAGKKVHFNYDNAWYSPAAFFAFDGEVSANATTFGGEVGVEVANQLLKLKTAYGAETLLNDDANTFVPAGLADESIAASVAGAYMYGDIMSADNADDIAVAVLPAFDPINTEAFGTDALSMKSFLGSKLCGVNSQSTHSLEAHSLAAYLTSEAVQADRLELRGAGPSNATLAASDDLATKNPALGMLGKMATDGNTVPQINLPSGFWDALPVFTKGIFAEPVLVDNALVAAELNKLCDSLVKGFKLAE